MRKLSSYFSQVQIFNLWPKIQKFSSSQKYHVWIKMRFICWKFIIKDLSTISLKNITQIHGRRALISVPKRPMNIHAQSSSAFSASHKSELRHLNRLSASIFFLKKNIYLHHHTLPSWHQKKTKNQGREWINGSHFTTHNVSPPAAQANVCIYTRGAIRPVLCSRWWTLLFFCFAAPRRLWREWWPPEWECKRRRRLPAGMLCCSGDARGLWETPRPAGRQKWGTGTEQLWSRQNIFCRMVRLVDGCHMSCPSPPAVSFFHAFFPRPVIFCFPTTL